MPHVVSTLTNGVDFAGYRKDTKDLNIPTTVVTIKGGHRLADKNVFTPDGVATRVTDEELEFLQRHKSFQHFVDKGFMKIVKSDREPAADKAVKDMAEADKSAPLTPEYYEKAQAQKSEDQRLALPKGWKNKKG